MYSRVQLKDKKKFLKWFLQRYQMKRRESMWILNYLLNHDIVLNKTKFVEEANKTPRGKPAQGGHIPDHPYRTGMLHLLFQRSPFLFHEEFCSLLLQTLSC